ncbi:MAG: homoserine dehydrogenase [Bacteroidetes bacterium]|nr:homoserine dehydrogenase [Bacteroidota bacterium]
MNKVLSIPIILIGVGNVGKAVLRQLLEIRHSFAERSGCYLQPVCVADSSGVVFDPDGISEETLQTIIRIRSRGQRIESLPYARRATSLNDILVPHAVIVDVTASGEMLKVLRAGYDLGCRIVLANKKPVAARWSEAHWLYENDNVRYEATVGAGLPVISTVRQLRETGDRILAIEGCMSGTLGFICAELERGVPYSVAIREAKSLGYTEPDPRDDLSGQDVARKALILARTAGWPLESDAIEVEPLYPDSLASLSIEDFMDATTRLDSVYSSENHEAQAKGHVLRYIARVNSTGGKVGLVSVPRDSAWGALRGSANYIAFTTTRYDAIPLAVSGPGAGAEVTAAGVLSDILSLQNYYEQKEKYEHPNHEVRRNLGGFYRSN